MSRWISNSPDETRKIASDFMKTLTRPAVIALHGDLGAGKTCFAQGLAQAAGVRDPVCSPTYTLIGEYEGDFPFHHIDLYRLGGPQEACDLGLDEYFDRNGLTVIEWAERAAGLLPPAAVHVRLTAGENERQRIISVDEDSQ